MSDRPSLAPASDFPILARRIEDRPITYLDSAATTLKPRAVIDAVRWFYEHSCGNVHRGDHTLSEEASGRYEAARDTVARFVNAGGREIVFTANATESLNLVAEGLDLQPGDNVVATLLEHHSNLLPYMKRCEVRFLPLADDGTADVARLDDLIDARTKLVAIGHISNVTGGINRVADAVAIAHRRGVPVAVDGAQSVPHLPVDVTELGCDFLAFSGHKMLGPSGIGVLFASERVWDRMRPLKLGGGTIDHVRTDGFELKRVPHRFEAGTPNIEGVLGLAAAIEYLDGLDMRRVAEHDAGLGRLLHDRLSAIRGVRLLGPTDPARKVGIATLVPTSAAVEVATLGHLLSDSYKVMVRSGTHCAHPYYTAQGLRGALRLSTYVYTSDADVLRAADALEELLRGMRAGPP